MRQVEVQHARYWATCWEGLRVGKPLGVLLDEVGKFVQACCSLGPRELGPGSSSKSIPGRGDSPVDIGLPGQLHIIHHYRVIHGTQ